MNPPEDRYEPLGTHLVHADGDTLRFIARGVLTGNDMRQILDLMERVRNEYGAVFIIHDSRRSTGLDSDARKLASSARTSNYETNLRVLFGVPFAMRVVLTMILHAHKLLGSRNVLVHVFDGEEEAWAFFEKERERLRAHLKNKNTI